MSTAALPRAAPPRTNRSSSLSLRLLLLVSATFTWFARAGDPASSPSSVAPSTVSWPEERQREQQQQHDETIVENCRSSATTSTTNTTQTLVVFVRAVQQPSTKTAAAATAAAAGDGGGSENGSASGGDGFLRSAAFDGGHSTHYQFGEGNDGVLELAERLKNDGKVGEDGDWPALKPSASACGVSEETACPDIRSGLKAIPKDLPSGQSPELRLLPGLYTGDNNVFFGGPADSELPDFIRDVRLVGWTTSQHVATGQGAQPEGTHFSHLGSLDATAVVLSCEGRLSPNETSLSSSSLERGVWLHGGRITQLANLTVTDCPGGGIGVNLSTSDTFNHHIAGDRASAAASGGAISATLSSVQIIGNGGSDCRYGGGLYITHATGALEQSYGYGGRVSMENGGRLPGGDVAAMLTVTGCLISNNTAQLGGGIGFDSLPAGPIRSEAARQVDGERGDFSWLDFRSGAVIRAPTHVVTAAAAESEWNGKSLDPLGVPNGDVADNGLTQYLPPNVPPGAPTLRRYGTVGVGDKSRPLLGRSLGKIHSARAQIVLDGATVVSHNTASSGGGVWASGAVKVLAREGTSIKENIARGLREGCGDEERCAGRGGGISLDGGSLQLEHVRLEANRAEAHQTRDEFAKGGGVAAKASTVELIGCTFKGNSAAALVKAAAGLGGGAYLDGTNATLSDCHFEANSAEGSDLFGQLSSFGGGLVARGPSCSATISKSTFIANTARRGGSGGALWAEDGAAAAISSSIFLNNTAASSYTHKGTGGAISVLSSATLVLSQGTVLEGNGAGPEDVEASDPQCLSGEGGAIHASGSDLSLTGVRLVRNLCETGALDAGCSGGAVSITGSGPSHGAVVDGLSSAGATFKECVFERNKARGAGAYSVYSGAGQGGAVAVRFTSPLFEACEFSENSADGGYGTAPATGGAVLLFLSRDERARGPDQTTVPTFVNCTFQHNRAGYAAPKKQTTEPKTSTAATPTTSGTATSNTPNASGTGNGVAGVSVSDLEGGHKQQQGQEYLGREGSLLGRGGQRGHGIGGALAVIASSPLLSGCHFSNNSAVAVFPSAGGGSDAAAGRGHSAVSGASPSFGGAIVLTSDCSGTRLNNCTLDGNVAVGGVGGDLAVLAAPSSSGHPASLGEYATSIIASKATNSADSTVTKSGGSMTTNSLDSQTTAVLTECTFNPAPPETDPAVNPWCDGHSETSDSPFLFLLDGGTVELVSPVFEGPGQAFVAQLDRPTRSRGQPDTDDNSNSNNEAHLRIVDGPACSYPSTPNPRVSPNTRPPNTSHKRCLRNPDTEVSLVSVGATITLLGANHGSRHSRYPKHAPIAPPFALRSLVLLRAELLLRDRGAVVATSARIRMGGARPISEDISSDGPSFPDYHRPSNVAGAGAAVALGPSSADVGVLSAGDGAAPQPMENGYSRKVVENDLAKMVVERKEFSRTAADDGQRDSVVVDNGRANVLQPRGGSLLSSGGAASAVAVTVAGNAVLGEAWAVKPFFLGTSLSQIFPSPPSPSVAPPTGGTTVAHEGGGGSGGSGEDVVTFDGVSLELKGSCDVRGEVHLGGPAVVKVDARGALTLAGNATFRRKDERRPSPESRTPETSPSISSLSAAEMAVLQNAGVLSVPRGFSLTVDGGISQSRSGTAVLALPPPLYSPSDNWPTQGNVLSGGAERGLEAVDGGSGGPSVGHPLVVESGVAKFAGAVNASVVAHGGESQRVKMHRKWAVVKFASNHTAGAADVSHLVVRGPPGVSMELSVQPIVTSLPTVKGDSEGQRPTPLRAEDGREPKDPPKWEWELVMEAAFIECQHMLSYANVTLAGGRCQACLLNAECSWCGDEEGKGCIPAAEGPIRVDLPEVAYGKRRQGSCQVGNCCPSGCNGVGSCDFFSGTCSCPWLYSGTSCGELSTRGAVALSLSLSALALAMLTLACGRSSRRKQMEAVVGTLQELKRGLLSDADGSVADDESSVLSGRSGFGGGRISLKIPGGTTGGSRGGAGATGGSYQHMWPRDYIQDLQQNLALRNVMVSFSELELSHKIGSGAAGSVWRGSWRGAAVAVKVIRRPFHQAVELTGRDLEVFKREAYLMTRLRHPNIVLIMGVTFAPAGHRITLDGQDPVSPSRRRELGFEDVGNNDNHGSLCIVTELLSRGSLEDVIREGGLRTASYALILDLALQAARGMLYLHTHSPPIVHRDLKSSNLVVDEHWHVKVTDFGMSRFVPEPPVVPAIASPPHMPHTTDATSTTTTNPVHPFSIPPKDTTGAVESSGAVDCNGSGREEQKQPTDANDANNNGDINSNSSGRRKTPRSSPRVTAVEEGGSKAGTTERSVAKSRRSPPAGGRGGAGRVAGGAGMGNLGLTTNLGTVAWAAPEMLLSGEGGRGEYTSKVDVYSFGVVLWELWERRRPFEDMRSRFDIADTVAAGGRPAIGRGCPPPYADLIRRCWHQDPSKRPLFQDVVEDLEVELGAIESLTEL